MDQNVDEETLNYTFDDTPQMSNELEPPYPLPPSPSSLNPSIIGVPISPDPLCISPTRGYGLCEPLNSCFKRSDNEESIYSMNNILKNDNREINLIGYLGGGWNAIPPNGNLPRPPESDWIQVAVPIEEIPYFNTIILAYANFDSKDYNPILRIETNINVGGRYYTGFRYPTDNVSNTKWLEDLSNNIKKWKEVDEKSYKGPKRKVLLTFGGTDDKFPENYLNGDPTVSGTYSYKLTKIQSNGKSFLINFLDDFNLDGIDLDYEAGKNMSSPDEDAVTGVKNNWRHIIKHLKYHGKIVTANPAWADGPGTIQDQYNYLINGNYMGLDTIDIMQHQMYNYGENLNVNGKWFDVLNGIKNRLNEYPWVPDVKLENFGSVFTNFPVQNGNCWNVQDYIKQIINQINRSPEGGNYVTNHGVFLIEYDYFYGYYFAKLINSIRDHSSIYIAKNITSAAESPDAGKVVKALVPDLFNQILYMYNSIIDKTGLKKIQKSNTQAQIQNIKLTDPVTLYLNSSSNLNGKDFEYVNYTSRLNNNGELAYDEIVLSVSEICDNGKTPKNQDTLRIQSGRAYEGNQGNFVYLHYSNFKVGQSINENNILILLIGDASFLPDSSERPLHWYDGTESYIQQWYFPWNNEDRSVGRYIDEVIIESKYAATTPKMSLLESELDSELEDDNPTAPICLEDDNPTAPICFIRDTPVKTDQGEVKIQEINTDIHTINGKKILAITKTKLDGDLLVRVEKNAFAEDCPNHSVVMSGNHKILYNNELIMAKDLALNMPGKLNYMKYMGDTLYNVLMENYETMMVNNMVVETLHPKNKIALLYRCLLKASNKERIETMKKYSEVENI
jgi:hypothetical protein